MSFNIPDKPAQTPTTQQVSCPICLTHDISTQQIYRTPCNHIFCAECMQSWIKEHTTCPICRFQIIDHNKIQPYDSTYNRDLNIITSLASRKPEQARLLYQEYTRWLQGTRYSRPIISA